jgi:hypothetical protein
MFNGLDLLLTALLVFGIGGILGALWAYIFPDKRYRPMRTELAPAKAWVYTHYMDYSCGQIRRISDGKVGAPEDLRYVKGLRPKLNF